MSELLKRAGELAKRLRSDMDAIRKVVDKVSAFDLAFDGADVSVWVNTSGPIETAMKIPSSLLLDSMGGKSEVRDQLIEWLNKYKPVAKRVADTDYGTIEAASRWLLSQLEERAIQIEHRIQTVIDGHKTAEQIRGLGEAPVSVTTCGATYYTSQTYTVPASSLVEHLVVEIERREGQLFSAIDRWESVVMPERMLVCQSIAQETKERA